MKCGPPERGSRAAVRVVSAASAIATTRDPGRGYLLAIASSRLVHAPRRTPSIAMDEEHHRDIGGALPALAPRGGSDAMGVIGSSLDDVG